MSFNYCSHNPTYYENCGGSGPAGCTIYSGYKVSDPPLSDQGELPYTINVGTYHACGDRSQNGTPYTGGIGPELDNTHVPVASHTVMYGTWNQNCGGQNQTSYTGVFE